MTTIESTLPMNAQSQTLPSLLERAKALAPRIRERTVEVEDQRHVHDETVQEMIDAGLFRSMQSKRWGGEEAGPHEFMEAVIEIGKACTSSAWVLCILTAHNWEMAHMSPQLQEEVYGEDPDTLLSSSYAQQGNVAVRVDGGLRISGKWKSSSGIHHAKWVALGVNVEGEAPHNIVVPLSDAKVVDDWYVLGMQGTGSRSVVLDDVFVPDHRAIDRDILLADAGPGLVHTDSPLFRVPQALIYSSVAAAPALGAGWRFYEEFPNYYGLSTSKAGRQIADDHLVLSKYAEARGSLNAQQLVFLLRHQQAYETAVRGEQMGELQIAESMFDLSKNGRVALDVATSLMPQLRPSAVYHTSIMQRLYRDIVVARQHGTQNADEAGRTMGLIQQGVPATQTFILPPARLEAARQRAADLGYLG